MIDAVVASLEAAQVSLTSHYWTVMLRLAVDLPLMPAQVRLIGEGTVTTGQITTREVSIPLLGPKC